MTESNQKVPIPEDLQARYQQLHIWQNGPILNTTEMPWECSHSVELAYIERIAAQSQELSQLREDAHNLKSSVHAICNQNLTEALAAAIEQTQINNQLRAERDALRSMLVDAAGKLFDVRSLLDAMAVRIDAALTQSPEPDKDPR